MKTTIKITEDAQLAAEIVSVLQPAALRACSNERDVIRYAVRGNSLKLRNIVLVRAALRRLLSDPVGAIKIEYLKRDLLRAATQRIEYRYPHSPSTRPKEAEEDLTIRRSIV